MLKYSGELVEAGEFEQEAFLSTELLHFVLQSRHISDKDKETIFNTQVSIQDEEFWEETTLTYLLNTSETPKLGASFDQCLSSTSDTENKIRLLLCQSHLLDAQTFENYLKQFDSEFSPVSTEQKSLRLTYTKLREDVCDKLQEHNIIKSFRINKTPGGTKIAIKC